MTKKALVVVESPAKAKTIQKYLGREYIVRASVGHIKDLPKNKLGVDTKKGFKPDYQLIPTKAKVLNELKKAYAQVPALLLATDPDREGEAIAWHIAEELKSRGKRAHRILFNAITKASVLESMKNPLELNTDKFHAQQTRRILDRLVGYKISPLLWDKVKRGLSAGRVQSVALRLIVDREKEIKDFKPEEYWEVEGFFQYREAHFESSLFKINGEDPKISNKEAVEALLVELKVTAWKISNFEQKERSRRASPPFITSRVQQDAARKLGFSAKKTMALAQILYEGVDLGDFGTQGLITYMRTDSTRVEPGAIASVREFIANTYGKEYLPPDPVFYKSKKGAQDAHEAIRPTSMEFAPEKIRPFVGNDEFRLYQLIWNRFVASQMNPAIYDQTTLDVSGKGSQSTEIVFRATGSILKFAGFTAVYTEGAEDEKGSEEVGRLLSLPPIEIGASVEAGRFTPSQHFTQPPPRYADASLIRELEEKGIGRPSTYATILSNLQDREYIEKRENRFYPSELGVVVTDLLVQAFPDILNAEFTAEMENQLDEIEEGRSDWKKTLATFWKPFEKTLVAAKAQMKNVKQQEVPTDFQCEKCNHTMVIKWGKLGSFLACSNYPECKNTQDFKKDEQGKIVIIPKEFSDKKCPKCANPMVVKSGKFGKFLACSDYPNCKTTQPVTIGVACPLCKEGDIVQKQSRYQRVFYSCGRWPQCNFASWDKPIPQPCPRCHFPILTERMTKRKGLLHRCTRKECGYVEAVEKEEGVSEQQGPPAATEVA